VLDLFTLSSPALPTGTRVVGFRGAEGISRLYAFEIHLSLGADASNDFDLAGVVGQKGALVIDRQDGRPPFAFHGIFSEATLVHYQPDGRALVRAVIVPRLWLLTQTHHSRIFTQQSIPDILAETLEDGGLTSADYSLRLTQPYATEEHVCQYRESHFDFVSRWMEREGLYYWFEQGDEGETLVIADDMSAHDDLVPGPLRFFALSGADRSAGECLQTFVCRQRALPASVRLRDYDHAKPQLDVSGTAPVSSTGLGEISVYGARFFTPGAGQRLAQLRAQEMLARQQVFTGSSTALYLRAGYTFSLQGHPRSSFDTSYLVTEVEHHGNQAASTPELLRLTGLASDEVYRAEVTAIPAAVQFRAELRTPWPRIYGTEHGVVDGEADSQYAQLDETGCYLVRFAFDESTLGAGKASTRVRMMQPHGGGIEGCHFPLRKGTEVLFTFLGGDPDRPVIAGMVPNALTPSPVNKANQTRNVIQTGGRNRMEFEDKQGFERMTLSTPNANSMVRMGSPNDGHEMIVRTDGATLLDTGQDWDVNVGGALSEYVADTTNETYQGDHTTQSWSNRTIEIGGDYVQNMHGDVTRHVYGDDATQVGGDQALQVGGDQATQVGGDQRITIAGGQSLSVGAAMSVTVATDQTETVGGASSEAVGGARGLQVGAGYTLGVGSDMSVSVGGDLSEGVTGGKQVQVGTAYELTCGPSTVHVDSGGNVTITASQIQLVATGPLLVKSDGALQVQSAGSVQVQGGTVDIN
jgi:type VI secretion system secreted protein VgrG